MIAIFKTRGKENGVYVRHAYIQDGDVEFRVCDRNVALIHKPTETMFMSQKGEKIRSDQIGKDCLRCNALCRIMSEKAKNFVVENNKVLSRK